jgi:hypothetical protein
VVELVDTLALGASAFGREGSSPFSRTKTKNWFLTSFLFWILLRLNALVPCRLSELLLN